MLNIVIPMAGLGSRFTKAGYSVPKPLIEVYGIPMIRLVIENIRPSQPHRFTFICQRPHVAEAGLEAALTAWAPECCIILLDELTDGAASTVLCARDEINSSDPLMIANSDQYVDIEIDGFLAGMRIRDLDGLIMTMDADDPKWSYAAVDPAGLVTQLAEKQPISRHATTGIYSFRKGADFVRAAGAMIANDRRVNGEFYVAPVYNELIAEGARIGIHDIGSEGHGMHGLGIPADLEAFIRLPLARSVTDALK